MSTVGSYRPRTGSYAILLTYIPSGVRVRATPASKLAKLNAEQAAAAGILTQITIHQPSTSTRSSTSQPPAHGPDSVLELDIDHGSLTLLGQPHLAQKLSASQQQQQSRGGGTGSNVPATEEKTSSFLEMLIAQLCIYVSSNEEYKLVFTPPTNEDDEDTQPASGLTTTSVQQSSSSSVARSQAVTTVSYQSIKVTKTTSIHASSSDEAYSEEEFDDPELAAEMIPAEVAAAARSEAPPPRSPAQHGRRANGIQSVPLPSPGPSPPGIASQVRTPLRPIGSSSGPLLQTPQSSTTPQHHNKPPPSNPATSLSTPPLFSPNVAQLMEELSGLRRENAELKHRNTYLQSQVDLKNAQELSHTQELAGWKRKAEDLQSALEAKTGNGSEVQQLWKKIAEQQAALDAAARTAALHAQGSQAQGQGQEAELQQLRRKVAELRQQVVDYEEQLYLLQPNIDKLAAQGIGPGKGKSPLSPKATGTGGSATAETDRSALVSSLRDQLSSAQQHASSMATAFSSLQSSFRTCLQQVQNEFSQAGTVLKHVAECDEAQKELLGEIGGMEKRPNTDGPFSPNTTRKNTPSFEQSFRTEDELVRSALAELHTTPIHSSPASLDSLLSVSHALEQRSTVLLQAVHERNRLLIAGMTTLQHDESRLKDEIQRLQREVRQARYATTAGNAVSDFGTAAVPSSTSFNTSSNASAAPPHFASLESLTHALGVKGTQLETLRQAIRERDEYISRTEKLLAQEKQQRMNAEARQYVHASNQNLSAATESQSALQALGTQCKLLSDQLAQVTKERNQLTDQLFGLEEVHRNSKQLWEEEMQRQQKQLESMDRQLKTGSASASGGGNNRSGNDDLLRSELANLRKLHTENSSNLLQIHASLNTKQMELVKLQTENLHLVKDNAQMEQIITLAREQTSVLSNKLSHFESAIIPGLAGENEALKQSVDTLSEEVDQSKLLLQNATRELDSLRADLDQSTRRLSVSEQARLQLESSLSNLRSEYGLLQTKLIDMELEVQTVSGRLSHNVNREKMDDALLKQIQAERKDLQQQCDALRKENEILGIHVNTTKANFTQLQQQHDELQQMHRQLLESRGSSGNLGASFHATNIHSNPPPFPLAMPSADPSDLAAIIKENFALKKSLYQQQQQHGVGGGKSVHQDFHPQSSSSSASPLGSSFHASTTLPGGTASTSGGFSASRSAAGYPSSTSSIIASSSSGSDPTSQSNLLRRLESDQEAALASYELLRSQVALQTERHGEKNQDLASALAKTKQLESQLSQAEGTIQSLQAQISKQAEQNESSIQSIQSLQHQLKSQQANLSHKANNMGEVENEITNLLQEKHSLQTQLSDARQDVHSKSLQIQDGLDLIRNLESELEALKLVLIPYQKQHLDIGCESIRLQQELELRNADETLKSLQKQLKSKDSQIHDLQQEISHTKSTLQQGNKEWMVSIPQLKREKQQAEDVLTQLTSQIQELFVILKKTKQERKGISRQSTLAQGTSPFKSSRMGVQEDDEPEFDDPSSATGSSSSANSKHLPSQLEFIQHDLSTILSQYLELLRTRNEFESNSSTLSHKQRQLEDSFAQERLELIRKLKNAESEIAFLESHRSKASNGVESLSTELSDLRNKEKQQREKLEQQYSTISSLQLDKKELNENLDSLLVLQKNWEQEREMMVQSYEALHKKTEKLGKQLENISQAKSSIEKTKEESQGKLSQLQAQLSKLQSLESDYAKQQDELDETKEKFERLKQELHELRSASNSEKSNNKSLSDELSELRKTRDQQSRMIEKLKSREDDLLRRSEELALQVTNLNRDAADPLSKLQEAHEKALQDLDGWQEKFSDLAQKLGQVCQEKDELQNKQSKQKDTYKDTIARMKQEYEQERSRSQQEAEETIRSLKAQTKSLSDNLELKEQQWKDVERSLQTQLNQAQKELGKIKGEYTRLTEKHSALEGEHTDVASEKQSLSQQLNSLQTHQNKLEQDLLHSQSLLDQEKEKCKKLLKENDKLSREITQVQREAQRDAELSYRTLEKEFERASNALEFSEREVTRLERGLELAQLERKEAEMKEKSATKQFSSVERELQLKCDLIEKLDKQKQEESKQFTEKSLQWEQTQRKLQETNQSLESRLKESESERQTYQRNLHESDRRVHELQVEYESLQRSHTEAERKLREAETELSTQQKAQYDSERKIHELQILYENSTREKIPRLETTIAQLTQTLYEHKLDRDASKKKVQELEYAQGEGRSKLEFDLSTSKKELSAVQIRLVNEQDLVSQLRSTIHQLEREGAYKLNQSVAEAQAKESELLLSQQSLSKLQADKEALYERLSKVERKLKDLSMEYDTLQKTHSKSTSTISTLESTCSRLQEKEHECRALHQQQWEPLLERTQKDLKEHVELVSILREQVGSEKGLSRTQIDEMKRIMDETLTKKDAFLREELDHLRRQHQDDIYKMDQAYEQLRQEYIALTKENSASQQQYLDQIHTLQTSLEKKQGDLERIRNMLGLEWEELFQMSENNALLERARSLFSNESQQSIAQLQDLVKQQNLHIQDAKAENLDLNQVIQKLKVELQGYKNQKVTEHSTMDKLLLANKRLQQFIDSLPSELKCSSGQMNSSSYLVPPTPFSASTFASRAASPYISPVKDVNRGSAVALTSTTVRSEVQLNISRSVDSIPPPAFPSTTVAASPSPSPFANVRTTTANASAPRDGLDALRAFNQALAEANSLTTPTAATTPAPTDQPTPAA